MLNIFTFTKKLTFYYMYKLLTYLCFKFCFFWRVFLHRWRVHLIISVFSLILPFHTCALLGLIKGQRSSSPLQHTCNSFLYPVTQQACLYENKLSSLPRLLSKQLWIQSLHYEKERAMLPFMEYTYRESTQHNARHMIGSL